MSWIEDRVFNVDDILESAKELDDFVQALCHLKMTNCGGSAHSDHRVGYTENGILIVSHWNTNNYVYIYIVSDKTATISPGPNLPTVKFIDPNPTVDKGTLIEVWSRGEWKKRGPWEKDIRNLIERLIARRIEKVKQNHEAKEAAERAKQKAEADTMEGLNAEWGAESHQ